MNSNERKIFWDTLCSFSGKDINAESVELASKIIYPDKIYRYRAITTSTIDALQTNMLYFSTANYYDDPFDTNIMIDLNEIRNRAATFFATPNIETLYKWMCDNFGFDNLTKTNGLKLLKNHTNTQIANELSEKLKTLNDFMQSILKQNIWSVCFSESGVNETMWLKYANQYSGYCLIYDIKDDSKLLCGKSDNCSQCPMIVSGATSLYPMYYSDDKYNATTYAMENVTEYICKQYISSEIFAQITSMLPRNAWEKTKVSLIKSKCHEYDYEWRLLCNSLTPNKMMRKWIPSGIIFGPRTSENERNLLIRSAKLAGIDHIYELYITDKYFLDYRELQ